jgi:hypothetical protein
LFFSVSAFVVGSSCNRSCPPKGGDGAYIVYVGDEACKTSDDASLDKVEANDTVFFHDAMLVFYEGNWVKIHLSSSAHIGQLVQF